MDFPESQLPPAEPIAAEPAAPELATPAELHAHHGNSFFFGRFGLRAGYGIAIFVVIFIALTIVGGLFSLAASGKLHEAMADRAFVHDHPHAPRPKLHLNFVPSMVVVNDGITFLGMLGVCWFFHRGERRPLRAYGIGGYRVLDILPGAFWGIIMLSAVVAVLRARGWLVFDNQNIHGTQIITYGLAWLLAFVCVGFSEEYAFRGYIQYTLMRGVWGLAEKISVTHTRAVAFWIAATFWSLLFGCAHLGNGGENAFGLLQVVLAGITFAYALWRTGSLWWAIGFHATWDWAQSFLYGVADSGNISVGRLFVTHPAGKSWLSGGADGPEGSIFATVALLLTLVVIRFTTRPGIQPALEQAPKAVAPPVPEFHNAVA
jgi:membrane protease YdiL (CAAX protease family)